MNAPITTVRAPRSINDLRAVFAGACESRADLYAVGFLTLQEAVDELQAIAVLTGLVEAIGQDAVQKIMVGAPPIVPEIAEAYDAEIMLRAAELVRQWEMADPRDRWKHTGEPKPLATAADVKRAPYAVPTSTTDAFLFVAALDDVGRV
jgi:hypothetical protein